MGPSLFRMIAQLLDQPNQQMSLVIASPVPPHDCQSAIASFTTVRTPRDASGDNLYFLSVQLVPPHRDWLFTQSAYCNVPEPEQTCRFARPHTLGTGLHCSTSLLPTQTSFSVLPPQGARPLGKCSLQEGAWTVCHETPAGRRITLRPT